MLHLQIYGETFAGFKAVYQYSVNQSADAIAENVASFAPDFARVIDWRLVDETNEYQRHGGLARRVGTFKTLRGFRAGMTPRRFDRLANL